MSATTKTSRNHQRKTLYASQADRASRNENTISAPIVGRLVTVTEKVVYTEDGREKRVKVEPYQTVVHDRVSAPLVVNGVVQAKQVRADKHRRQLAAWGRCRYLPKHDVHGRNCRSCGCPVAVQS